MYYTFSGQTFTQGRWVAIVPEVGDSLSYDDFEPFKGQVTDKKALYLLPSELSGGDYCSSGTVNVSNHRVFLKLYEKVEGVYDVYSGYGGYAVAIRLDVLDSNPEIKEALDGLEGYPVIDEEDLSQLEWDKSKEAWDDWVRRDAVREVQKDPFLEEWDPEDDDEFYLDFTGAAEEAGVYWEPEGQDMRIDVDRVAPYLTDRIVLKQIPKSDLPLLLSRKWSSKSAQAEYEKLLKGVAA